MTQRPVRARADARLSALVRGEIPGWVLGVVFVMAVLAAAWALMEPTLSRWIGTLSAR